MVLKMKVCLVIFKVAFSHFKIVRTFEEFPYQSHFHNDKVTCFSYIFNWKLLKWAIFKINNFLMVFWLQSFYRK